MKKNLVLTIFSVIVMYCQSTFGQVIPTYPIPSYGVHVFGYANFREGYHNPAKSTREKMTVNVVVTSVGTKSCIATVWVYSLDQTTVLGPYTVTCGQTLSVPIDERQWGVLVESEEEVIVDVWIDSGDNTTIQGCKNEKKDSNHQDYCAICEFGTSSEDES
ncbi:MAG: hypothetical protein Q8L68_07600 [Methylococcales bacterium]|nr:hypothetical protein [Methylococcales bacterium]